MVGLSDILIYLESPYQYLLRRRANIQPSIGEELGYGDSMHELIQARYESDIDSWSYYELREEMKKHVHLPYMSKSRKKASERAINERMQKLEDLGVFDGDVEVEKKVDVIMENGVVHGIVDFIEHLDDDKVMIRDWKTSVHEEFLPRYKNQILFYTLALEKRNMKVEKAEIVDISETFESNEIRSYEVKINQNKIDKFKDKLEYSLKKISDISN